MAKTLFAKLCKDTAIVSGGSIFLLLLLIGDLAFISMHVLPALDSQAASLFALG